jgi:hypothetical protein
MIGVLVLKGGLVEVAVGLGDEWVEIFVKDSATLAWMLWWR